MKMIRAVAQRCVAPSAHSLFQGVALVVLLMIGAGLTACEEEPAPRSEPPGTTVAREHLYPYRFDGPYTMRGVDVLQEYLKGAIEDMRQESDKTHKERGGDEVLLQ